MTFWEGNINDSRRPLRIPLTLRSITIGRIPTSTSVEGEEVEEDDLQDDDLRDDDEELEERRPHHHGGGADDFDDMEEDPNRYQPLKRRASTGTLLSQARVSTVTCFVWFLIDTIEEFAQPGLFYFFKRVLLFSTSL